MTVLNDSDISFDESSSSSQGFQGEGEFNEQSLNEIAQQMGLSKEQAQ